MDSISAAGKEQRDPSGEGRVGSQDRDVETREASNLAAADFTCPVCGARQALTDTCRRCRADLSLVVGIHSELADKRARCLALVRQRRLFRATRLARECLELSRDECNLRLLATCYLLQGDYAAALRLKGP